MVGALHVYEALAKQVNERCQEYPYGEIQVSEAYYMLGVYGWGGGGAS